MSNTPGIGVSVPRGLSIRVKLFLVIGTLLAVITFALTGAAYREMRGSAMTTMATRLDGVATQWARLFESSVAHQMAALRAVRSDHSINEVLDHPTDSARSAAGAVLGKMIPAGMQSVIQVLRADGTLVASVGDRSILPYTTGARESIARATARDSGVMLPLRAADTNVVTLSGIQIADERGNVRGYIVQSTRVHLSPSPEELNRLFGGEETAMRLANRDGSLWTDLARPIPVPPLDSFQNGALMTYTTVMEGRPVFAHFRPVSGTPWMVVLETSQGEVLAQARSHLGRIVATGGIISVLGLLVAVWLSATFTLPLARLTSAAEAVAAGDYSRHLTVDQRGDELGHLARAFNTMVVEIQAAQQSKELIRRQDERYRRLALDSPHGITLTTLDGRILSVNPAFTQMLGYDTNDEVMALGMTAMFPTPADRERLIKALEDKGQLRRHEAQLQRKDGGLITVLFTKRFVNDLATGERYHEAVIEDVTELRRVEAQFLQAQKMDAVGQLAGGVAHDFNNLLTVIISYSELLLLDLPPEDTNREAIDTIRTAALSAASLTRQLLVFSRQQVIEPKVMPLNELVAGAVTMLTRLLGEHVELSTALDPAAGSLKIDPGHMEQIIVNLAVNARDAMPLGGRLLIESTNVDFEEAVWDRDTLHPAGRSVVLSVSDNGAGMDAELQTRVFEPFFTTKAPGSGTGLGLTTVYGIVKQAGGQISLYSEPGRGTSVKMYFPRFDQASEERAENVRAVVAPRGTETVLVVEDQSAVRAIAREVLERSGYHVLEASNGADALEFAQKHTGHIHLLITDVVMPRMSGREFADKFARIRPSAGILFMSGYTDDAIVQHGVLEREMHFLHKPFTPMALLEKVRVVLDGRVA